MIHVYAASNATWLSQRVLRLSRQRAASAHVIIEIGKSKRGEIYLQHNKALTERAKRAEFFISTETNFDGASEASGVLLAKAKV